MRVGVLGTLVVVRDGEPVEVGGPKPRTVLVTLVHHLDEVVPVDTLVEALWGDEPPASRRNAIQVNISLLRRALGPSVLLRTAPAGYLLASAGVDSDVVEFERLARSAADAGATDDPRAVVAAASSALDLWRGRPVGEELDIGPIRGRVAALHELRTRTRTLLLAARLQLGEHRDCCADAEALVREHPFREDVRALHLLALYRSGRQTEALAAYRETRELLVEELGVEPGPELRLLHRRILEQDAALDLPRSPAVEGTTAPTVAVVTDNLRPEPNVFVDRPEVDQVLHLLGAGRVVTAAGIGGIGKSRCVAAAARRCRDRARFEDGVWLVDLAPLPEGSDDVAATVAGALGLGRQPDATATEAVVRYLAHRRALVVLDNCEHVAAAAARFVDDVLAGAPSTSVLAASRVRLGVPTEHVVDVDRLPDDAARALLSARVTEMGTGPFHDDECAELCEALDNYPLAIELAAARTTMFTPREIVKRLASQPDLLRTVRADPSRGNRPHVDLAHALDWSIGQLSERARGTLDAATVFVTDFDLDSAEEVLATERRTAADVDDDLGELVEHHLLHRDHVRARFRMLEPIRQHRSASTRPSVRQRYVDRYGALAIEAAIGLRGPDEARWWDRVHADLPHLREAVRMATAREDVGLLDSIMVHMAMTSWVCAFTEPCEWAIDSLHRLRLAPHEAPGIAAAAAVQFAHLEMMDECDDLLDRLEADVDEPGIRSIVYAVMTFREPNELRWWELFREASDECGDAAMRALGRVYRPGDGVALADRHGNPTLRVMARQFRSASMREPTGAEARSNREELYRIALTSNNSKTIAEGEMFMALQHCYDREPGRAAPLAVDMIERLARTRSPFWIWHGVEVVAVMLAMVRMEPFTSETLWAAVTASGRTPFSRLTRNPALPEWVASQLDDDERRRAVQLGSCLDMDAAALEARKAAERMAGG